MKDLDSFHKYITYFLQIGIRGEFENGLSRLRSETSLNDQKLVTDSTGRSTAQSLNQVKNF